MRIDTLDIHKQLATAKLPSLPQVLLELLALCDRDDVGMAEIGAAVAKDAGVAARIVSIANSPYYRPGRTLENLGQCLSVLGTSTVRKLALNQSVVELFGRFQNASDYDLRYFWFHGLCVAVTARKLATRLGYGNVEEAYLAGLLHDVGQLALLSTVADRYLPMFKHFTGEHELMRQEQAAFGVTHAEVGAWLAERWNLHALFVDSILYHHESLERVREAHPLVQIVMLANLFNALPEAEIATSEQDLAFWQLDAAQALALMESAQVEARAIAAELGIDIPMRIDPVPEAAQAPGAGLGELAEAVSQRMEGMLAQPEVREPDSLDEAMLDLLQSASLLFGARDSALFLPEGDSLRWKKMQGADMRGGERDMEIRIDGSSPQSRIALAYRGRIGLAGQNAQADNLADAQVLRLLGGDRLLCFPLVHEGQPLGALAVGLDLATVERFARRQALLVTFAREAGKRLGLAQKQHRHVQAARDEAAQRHELHVRKLVHEAGNPLGVVRNYLAVLRQQVANQDQAKEDIDLIEDELRRVARILQQMRKVDTGESPTGGANPRVDMNSLVKEVIQFCRLGKQELNRVEVSFTPAPDLPLIATEPDKVKQVLTNLIFNAAEAMGGAGHISLSTAWWCAGKDRNTLEITVGDDGPGLPKDVLEHLYQPVRSEKGEGHSGLGLSIVAGLVEGMGGALQCSSSPDGTRFQIHLPVTGQTA